MQTDTIRNAFFGPNPRFVAFIAVQASDDAPTVKYYLAYGKPHVRDPR